MLITAATVCPRASSESILIIIAVTTWCSRDHFGMPLMREGMSRMSAKSGYSPFTIATGMVIDTTHDLDRIQRDALPDRRELRLEA